MTLPEIALCLPVDIEKPLPPSRGRVHRSTAEALAFVAWYQGLSVRERLDYARNG